MNEKLLRPIEDQAHERPAHQERADTREQPAHQLAEQEPDISGGRQAPEQVRSGKRHLHERSQDDGHDEIAGHAEPERAGGPPAEQRRPDQRELDGSQPGHDSESLGQHAGHRGADEPHPVSARNAGIVRIHAQTGERQAQENREGEQQESSRLVPAADGTGTNRPTGLHRRFGGNSRDSTASSEGTCAHLPT